MNKRRTEFAVRTDLAVEEKESFPGDGGEIEGVSLREWREAGGHMKMTEVRIRNSHGARAMGKPVGTYLTLELDQGRRADAKERSAVAGELAVHIRERLAGLLGFGERLPDSCRILAAGLGNPGVTADALGPRTVSRLQVTRHLNAPCRERLSEHLRPAVLSAIIPGVTAQTGMETAEILRGVIRETHPDVVIAIDALAARSVRRLGSTIQLTDTGIHPGSGVGNHRHGLTRESLGVPVLAIGVPTVVGAAAIVQDTLSALTGALRRSEGTRQLGDWLVEQEPVRQYALIKELLEPEFGSLYVTPPDIDELVSHLSDTISEAIRITAQG